MSGRGSPAAGAAGHHDGPVLDRLRALAAWVPRMLRGMLGANAYESYVAHERAHHPGRPVMTEREFWRWQADEEDRHPSARCC
ncbi:YbdD/YjiX family protein [Pseudoclavibacter caeni]|uniref:YbdD/YjiX family protein n=1 Tax=Pseudoclavibacter caeni TaxID=908846 RepID=A0A7C8BMK6_9MICO|nr:YbdD/YjiX family protein [Pseudoclavibacter caeni]KAB1631466.1 YbdD/YjiX family protein [Pseudoclavibacter caeni]NYJ97791.1 uncharacterized short protein YbdD (DUF466 family) [Pseudoclavibacter caeni]